MHNMIVYFEVFNGCYKYYYFVVCNIHLWFIEEHVFMHIMVVLNGSTDVEK